MVALPTMFSTAVSLTRVLDRPVEALLARRQRCFACGWAVRPWQRKAQVRGLPAHHNCAFSLLSSRVRNRMTIASDAGLVPGELVTSSETAHQAETMGIPRGAGAGSMIHSVDRRAAPDRQLAPASASARGASSPDREPKGRADVSYSNCPRCGLNVRVLGPHMLLERCPRCLARSRQIVKMYVSTTYPAEPLARRASRQSCESATMRDERHSE